MEINDTIFFLSLLLVISQIQGPCGSLKLTVYFSNWFIKLFMVFEFLYFVMMHLIDGHEFEQALGVGDGQGSLSCCMQSMGSQRVRHN